MTASEKRKKFQQLRDMMKQHKDFHYVKFNEELVSGSLGLFALEFQYKTKSNGLGGYIESSYSSDYFHLSLVRRYGGATVDLSNVRNWSIANSKVSFSKVLQICKSFHQSQKEV